MRLILGVALILTVPLSAQPVNRLQRALADADNALRAGHFEEAQRRLAKLSTTIAERFGSGSQAMYTVAVVASFRAIAAAGLHKPDDAAWYWSIARSLYPKFGRSDLHVYGAAGAEVMKIDASMPCALPEHPPGIEVTPPKPIEHSMPKYPYHAIETGIAEPVVVEFIVDEHGVPICPSIVDTHDDPSLAWFMLEAIRNWRYEPATIGGVAVRSAFTQTIDFRIRYY